MYFTHSRNIQDYSLIFTEMVKDWEYEHYQYILTYCGIIPLQDDHKPLFWDMWLVYNDQAQLIGLCSVYEDSSKKRCWLGWYGVLPKFRYLGYGEKILNYAERAALVKGFTELYCYCTDEPLDYYFNNGFKRIGNVEEFLNDHYNEYDLEEFVGEYDNHVIKKQLI